MNTYCCLYTYFYFLFTWLHINIICHRCTNKYSWPLKLLYLARIIWSLFLVSKRQFWSVFIWALFLETWINLASGTCLLCVNKPQRHKFFRWNLTVIIEMTLLDLEIRKPWYSLAHIKVPSRKERGIWPFPSRALI